MSKRLKNFIEEKTTTTGTGNLSLSSKTGFRQISQSYSTGGSKEFYYAVRSHTSNEWEMGKGHLSDSTTLVRDAVIDSSNGGSKVDFSAGSKSVVIDQPAEHMGRADPLVRKVVSSSQSDVQITSEITDRFDKYEVEIYNLLTASSTGRLMCQYSNDGGSSFESSSYSWRASLNGSSNANDSDSRIPIMENSFGNDLEGATAETGAFNVEIIDPSNPSVYTLMKAEGFWYGDDGKMGKREVSACRKVSEAVDGLKFYAVDDAGTKIDISNGIFELYGVG